MRRVATRTIRVARGTPVVQSEEPITTDVTRPSDGAALEASGNVTRCVLRDSSKTIALSVKEVRRRIADRAVRFVRTLEAVLDGGACWTSDGSEKTLALPVAEERSFCADRTCMG